MTMPRTYLRLPVNADEGFPQSFRFGVGGSTYAAMLYVSVLDQDESRAAYDLTTPGASLVLRIVREGPAEPRTIFLRRLVVDHEYEAGDLALLFRELKVDRRNLNGAGAFGSVVRGGVASR
jgi:hypothetical protein